ncbi:MAG: hypothetical protein ACLFUJ_06920 [Phycisphaerae bacterium]
MNRERPIQIACPELGRRVRGSYHPGPGGQFCYGPAGDFLLDFVTCSQNSGRCCQTLCALHRYNRRGQGTWYPDRLYAMGQVAARPANPQARRHNRNGSMDLQA